MTLASETAERSETTTGDGRLVMLRESTVLALRTPRHLQFGALPGQSLVLEMPPGVSAAQVMLVLREAHRPVDTGDLATGLGHCGIAAEHAAGILADLVTAGILRPLPAQQVTVRVTGSATMSAAVLQHLRRSGVDAVPVTPGSPSFGGLTAETPVVLAGQLFPPEDVTRRLMENAVPHLPCGVDDGRVVVGPLVLPGTTACLSCIDTRLLSVDPEWRFLRAQSGGVPAGNSTTPLAEMTAALTASLLKDALGDGSPGSPGSLDSPGSLSHGRQGHPGPLASRWFLDPAGMDLSQDTPVRVPGCRSCGAAGAAVPRLSGSYG